MIKINTFLQNRKFPVYLIFILIVINIITIFAFTYDFNFIQAPETTISLDLIDINPQDATIKTIITIKNPNNFDLIIKNLRIFTYVTEGERVASLTTDGGIIYPYENETFTGISIIDYQEKTLNVLTSEINCEAGIQVYFMKKLIPFQLKVETSIGQLIEDVASPFIQIEGTVNDVSQQQVDVTLNMIVYNPNVFDILLTNTSININNEKNQHMGIITTEDVRIQSNNSNNLTIKAIIPIKLFNAEELSVNMNTNITAYIAGYKKTVPFSLESKLYPKNLIIKLLSDLPTKAIIKGDYQLTLQGLQDILTLEINNPNDIDFFAKDIDISIYRIDNDIETEISNSAIEGGIIYSENITTLQGEILIPYAKLFIPPRIGSLFPDWLKIQVSANMTIQGLDTYWWMELQLYQDLKLL